MTKAQKQAQEIAANWFGAFAEQIPAEAIEWLIKSIAEQTRLHVLAQLERYDTGFCEARRNIVMDACWEDKQA